MGIFEQATPIDSEVNRIKGRVKSSYTQLRHTFDILAAAVWRNPDFTPEQVLQGLGSDAKALFTLSGATAQLIYLATGEVLNPIPDGYTYTINDDGTIVITASPEGNA